MLLSLRSTLPSGYFFSTSASSSSSTSTPVSASSTPSSTSSSASTSTSSSSGFSLPLLGGSGERGRDNHELISLERVLSEIILGVNCIRTKNDSVNGVEDTGDLIAKRGSEALQAMIALSSFLEVTDNPNQQNPFDSLKSNIFQAFLALRPTLGCPSQGFSVPTYNSIKELYSLAFVLLNGMRVLPAAGSSSVSGPLSFSVHLTYRQRRDIAISLTVELRAASTSSAVEVGGSYSPLGNSIANGSAPSSHRRHIGGVLGLLVALLSPIKAEDLMITEEGNTSDVLQILCEDYGILQVLLVDCLGLLPVASMVDVSPALCTDDQSRISAYELITILCDWRHTIVADVLRYLKPVHESIPPLIGTYILLSSKLS